MAAHILLEWSTLAQIIVSSSCIEVTDALSLALLSKRMLRDAHGTTVVVNIASRYINFLVRVVTFFLEASTFRLFSTRSLSLIGTCSSLTIRSHISKRVWKRL